MKIKLVFENLDEMSLSENNLAAFAFSEERIVFLLKPESNDIFNEFGMKTYKTTVFERIKRDDIARIYITDASSEVCIPFDYTPRCSLLGSPNTYQETETDDLGRLIVKIKRG